MVWRAEQPDGEAVIRVRGSLDGRAIYRLRELLDAERLESVVLDLSEAEPSDYVGLVILARELEVCSAEVQLRGLGTRQVRLLRYFGFDPSQWEA